MISWGVPLLRALAACHEVGGWGFGLVALGWWPV